MRFDEKILRTAFGAASYVFLGDSSQADWIYEKIHYPRTCAVLAMNVLYYLLRRPKVRGIISLIVEPVSACNLKCTYCWGEMGHLLEGLRPEQMTWELFCQAIDQAPRTIETVAVGGQGEPMLHPQFNEMIDYIEDRGMRAILYTNGTLLTGDRLERLARTKLSVMNLSIEPDAETCREYRGIDLETIKRNVREFLDKKQPKTEVKLSLVAHDGNVDRLESVWDEWAGMISEVKVSPRFGNQGDPKAILCMEPWRGSLYIMTNGNVTPCCFDCFEDLVIGNIGEQTLGEIIHGQAYRGLLARFLKGDTPERCMTCTQFRAPRIPLRAPMTPTGQENAPDSPK